MVSNNSVIQSIVFHNSFYLFVLYRFIKIENSEKEKTNGPKLKKCAILHGNTVRNCLKFVQTI